MKTITFWMVEPKSQSKLQGFSTLNSILSKWRSTNGSRFTLRGRYLHLGQVMSAYLLMEIFTCSRGLMTTRGSTISIITVFERIDGLKLIQLATSHSKGLVLEVWLSWMDFTFSVVISASAVTISTIYSISTWIRKLGLESKHRVSCPTQGPIIQSYFMTVPCMYLQGTMDGPGTMTYGVARLKIRSTNGSRFRQQEHSHWTGLVTLLSFVATQCLWSVAGMVMTQWMTFTSTVSLQSCGLKLGGSREWDRSQDTDTQP